MLRITKAQRGYCLAKTKLDGNSIQALSSLPGFKKWIGRDLLFDPTGANIERLHKFFPDAQWDESAQPALDQYINNLKDYDFKHVICALIRHCLSNGYKLDDELKYLLRNI